MDKLKSFLGSKLGKALVLGLVATAGAVGDAAGLPVLSDAARLLAGLLGLAG